MQQNDVEIDSYGCLTIATPKFCNNSAFDVLSYNSQFIYMTDAFFKSHCCQNKDGTRKLMLNGRRLFSEIQRRFENWDTPYLALFLKKNQDVARLDLSYNNIDSSGFISIIEYIINSDHILELDLRYNHIDDSGINYLLRDGDKLKLKVLRLSGNKMGFESAKKVALIVQKNTFIKQLDVADIDQTEESLIYFTTILRSDQHSFNGNLKFLDLSRPITKCLYSKFNSQHIAEVIGSMLRNNTSLERIRLQKFNFSCHDIEAMLENAKYNRTLRSLDLRCNNIGDHGVELLSKWLQERPVLQILLLGHNIITNHGIRALSRGISFSKITILDVSYNRFGDEGCIELLHSLRKSPMIEQILIYGNKIGHSTAKVVKRMILSGVLNKERIDVQVYEVDQILQFAYRECQTFLLCNETII